MKQKSSCPIPYCFYLILSCICWTLVFCFIALDNARAGGLWLYEGSIPDMGMANAGRAASALDASTAGGNPAAMTVLERNQLVTGFMGILPKTKFRVNDATYSGGGGGDAGYFTPNSTFAYVHRVNDRLRLGIILGSYFGLGLNYGDHWSGRYYVQDGKLLTAGINPSIGYKVNDYFSMVVVSAQSSGRCTLRSLSMRCCPVAATAG